MNTLSKRRSKYWERNHEYSWCTRIRTPLFCFECKSRECSNPTHNKIELHPIIRVPRKTASKLRWKQFYIELKRIHGHCDIVKKCVK